MKTEMRKSLSSILLFIHRFYFVIHFVTYRKSYLQFIQFDTISDDKRITDLNIINLQNYIFIQIFKVFEIYRKII